MSAVPQESSEMYAAHLKTEILSETLCSQLCNKDKLPCILLGLGRGA